jgi:hypothetical protein
LKIKVKAEGWKLIKWVYQYITIYNDKDK